MLLTYKLVGSYSMSWCPLYPLSCVAFLTQILNELRLALPFQQDSLKNMLHAHASPSTYILGGILVWMATVRSLRWRRYHAIHRKYLQKWENGKGPITAEEAQEIITVGAAYDMPLLLNYALAFALFKTYAIVRIFVPYISLPVLFILISSYFS